MQVIRLKHIKRYRVGRKVYWYHRVTRERLPDDETERAQRVLHINRSLDGWRDDAIPGSVADVIARYRASPEFKRLAESTRKRYLDFLDRLAETVPDTRIADIDVAWLYEARDSLAHMPSTADKMLAILSILLSFSVKRGLRQDNPARHVERLGGGKSFEPWPEAAIERFRAGANRRAVWAVELAIYTGQRQSDVLAMQWRHIKDGLIWVVQQKTGEPLAIPIHPALAEVLEEIPRVGTNIVHREDGRAYTRDGFRSIFQRDMKRLDLAGLQFHGLRHTAGRMLAEAGCTDREIMAITGHKTAAMVTRYTRRADQERLARGAITKLVTRTKLSKPTDGTV